jgi:hypothetical protein
VIKTLLGDLPFAVFACRRQAGKGGRLFAAFSAPLRACPFSGGRAGATGSEYQYRLTEMVLAFTMSGPK